MKPKRQNRREFLRSGAAGLAGVALIGSARGEIFGFADGDPFPELVEATITELQAK